MAVAAKICGLNEAAAVAAAVAGGAGFVGFVFYPPSPRAVTPAAAAALAAAVPESVARVGLFVDPDDALLADTLAAVALDMVQLHGRETPARVAAIKARFALPAMKAVPVACAADLDAAAAYQEVADWLLFDAKPPAGMTGALPGGNALSFDWQLLAGRRWAKPWMLSGGLSADNLGEAVRISGARAVDVSSGVEDRPGLKNPAKIAAFLDCAAGL
jgi:phosphoribosylanthranilate isomerase